MFPHLVSRFALALALTTAPLSADPQLVQLAGMLEEVGGAERIDRAGSLRMLSQRISAATCNAAAGIAVEEASRVLAADADGFDKVVNALYNGDESLGIIGAEEDRRVLESLDALNAIWAPKSVEIRAALDRGLNQEDALVYAELAFPLLEAAKDTVVKVRNEYADPTALVVADAIVIDVAGRQRMLAQRISKNACLMASGLLADKAKSELINAVETYDVSLQALRFGMAAAGISSPPSQEIRAGLDEIAQDWEGLKPTVTAIIEGQQVSDEARADLFVGALGLTGKMNTLVGKYAEASKLGL